MFENNLEPWIWQRMVKAVLILLVTYVPLQVFALWRQRRGYRFATAAPLLVMVPTIVGACSPSAYRDGSLFGMNYFFFYFPSMLYLAGAAIWPPKLCPRCGRLIPRSSFQRAPAACRQCEDNSHDPASKPERGNIKFYDRRSLIGLCGLVAMFCLYGFIAAGEPGPNHAAFRVGYAAVGVLCFVVVLVLGTVGRD